MKGRKYLVYFFFNLNIYLESLGRGSFRLKITNNGLIGFQMIRIFFNFLFFYFSNKETENK